MNGDVPAFLSALPPVEGGSDTATVNLRPVWFKHDLPEDE